jgi:hypothetical protein
MELYQVGNHVVKVTGAPGRWTVAVDEAALDRSFPTPADAWAAGVHEVDRLEARRAPEARAAPRGAGFAAGA